LSPKSNIFGVHRTVASTAVEIANLDLDAVPVLFVVLVAVAVAAPLLLDLPNHYYYPPLHLR